MPPDESLNAETKKMLFQVLAILEIILNLSTYLITIFCLYVLCKNPMFHTNLIRLIKCAILYYSLSQIMRLIMIFGETTAKELLVLNNNSKNYLIISWSAEFKSYGFFRLYFLVATFAALGTIACERICATIWLATYEKNVSNLIFVFGLICHIPMSLGITIVIYLELINLILAGALIILANSGGYCVLRFLEWFNTKRYNQSLIKFSSYTLSERFQLQENIRTALLLKKIILFLSLYNLIIGCCIFASQYYTSDLIRRIAYTVLNYMGILYGFTFLLFTIHSTAFLKKMLQRFKSTICQSRVSTDRSSFTSQQRTAALSKQVRGFNGTKIIFTVDEEREVYFKQLQNGWN